MWKADTHIPTTQSGGTVKGKKCRTCATLGNKREKRSDT